MRDNSVLTRLATGLLVVACLPGGLRAEGFRNAPEGARAIGAFGGYRAFADDATAVIHNPANLVDFDGPEVQVSLLSGYARTRFRSSEGERDRTDDPFFMIPGIAAVVPVPDTRAAVGLALYIPYGRGVEWPRDGYFAQRGLPYAGSMMVADLTPNAAVQVTDSLSVALGADLYYGRVHQDTLLIGLEPLGIPNGTRSRIEADGQSAGWNAAATWQATARQRLALTYRSPFSIRYTGDNTLSIGMQSDVSARIHYPTIVGAAYGVALTDTLRAEINGEWLEFSRYETLTLNDSVFGPQVFPQNLKDTWTAGIGVQWQFQPEWTLRSGYKYVKNPTPDATYGPLSPDEDQGVIALGIGYANARHAIDAAWAYGIFDGRTIPDSNPAGGRYTYDVQLLSVSYSLKL